MIASRRRFLIGAGALLAAPAIVRASNLMAVKPLPELIASPNWHEGVVTFTMSGPMIGDSFTISGCELQEYNGRWTAVAGTGSRTVRAVA